YQSPCLLFILYMDFTFLQLFIEIAGLYRLIFDSQQASVKVRRQFGRKICFDRPVLGLCKVPDLSFAFDDKPQGDRLNPARRKAPTNFVPEKRADLIANYTVQKSTRLLSVYEVFIDVCRMFERLLDGLLCDLVKKDSTDGFATLATAFKLLFYMPAYGFSLAVGVRCDIDSFGFLCRRLEFLYYFFLAVNYFVGWLKLMLKIDAYSLLRQVLDVSNRSEDFVGSA